jgi:hypothetical protein
MYTFTTFNILTSLIVLLLLLSSSSAAAAAASYIHFLFKTFCQYDLVNLLNFIPKAASRYYVFLYKNIPVR